LSIEKYKQKENSQIARLFNISDPNIEIIYVCPFPLTPEVYDYYTSILELIEVKNPDKRITIIVPENYVKYRRHMCLTQ